MVHKILYNVFYYVELAIFYCKFLEAILITCYGHGSFLPHDLFHNTSICII